MYAATISVHDLDTSTPQEAAQALVEWVRSGDDSIFVAVREYGVGSTLVRVEHEPTRRERAAALLTDTDIDGILAAQEG